MADTEEEARRELLREHDAKLKQTPGYARLLAAMEEDAKNLRHVGVHPYGRSPADAVVAMREHMGGPGVVVEPQLADALVQEYVDYAKGFDADTLKRIVSDSPNTRFAKLHTHLLGLADTGSLSQEQAARLHEVYPSYGFSSSAITEADEARFQRLPQFTTMASKDRTSLAAKRAMERENQALRLDKLMRQNEALKQATTTGQPVAGQKPLKPKRSMLSSKDSKAMVDEEEE